MLHVTWEWIGISDPALDVANTVAIEKGVAHDLLARAGEYERWAAAAATSPALGSDEAGALLEARPRLLELREHIRALLGAAAVGERPPESAVTALNRASAASPTWVELGADAELRHRAAGDAVDRVLSVYARSAIEIAADGTARLRVCSAPSCGMYYRPSRRQQRWCSVPCGTRARVARHYQPRRTR